MKPIRLAVIGAGHLGRIHAKLLAAMDDVELVGIVDPLASARETVAQENGTWAYADHREICDNLDGAVVATPTRFHHLVAMDLLRRGIPLLVEKPMASDLGQCNDMLLVARRKQIALQVGHIERFNPAFVAAAPHLREPKFIEAVRAGSFTFRSTDVGVVLDLMIHDLDLVMAMAGSPVKNVQALGLAIMGQHEDVAHARLEFENGCVANLSASRVAPAAKRQMQVWAQHAYGVIDFGNRAASVTRPSGLILRREIDVEKMDATQKQDLKDRFATEYLRQENLVLENRNAMHDEQRDFIDAVRQNVSPRVDGEQGRNVVAVAERILTAIAEHRWQGTAAGPTGPLAVPATIPLTGPHWSHHPAPNRRMAG